MLAFKAFKDCLLDVADETEVDEEAVTEANEDVDTATVAEPPEVVLIAGLVDKLKVVAPVVGVAWALLPGFLAPNNSSASVALSC